MSERDTALTPAAEKGALRRAAERLMDLGSKIDRATTEDEENRLCDERDRLFAMMRKADALLSSPRVEEEEKAHCETLEELDAMTEFVACLYAEVTGNECVWSNNFGLPEIRDAIITATREEEVRREALEEAAKVADEMAVNRDRVSGVAAHACRSIASRIRSLSPQEG